jgi:hypothetical protein
MRRLILAALIAAAPTAAQAASGESWGVAEELCQKTGGSLDVCFMKHVPSEALALKHARETLATCQKYAGRGAQRWVNDWCDEARAYIRQRWGY